MEDDEQETNQQRPRLIATTIVLLVALVITIFVIPSSKPYTFIDGLRIAAPAILTGFFFLGFPKIAELSRELTALFISHVAKEIVTQVSGISFPLASRTNRRNNRKGRYTNPLVLDTSAIIDGRIEYILGTGFLFGTFLVPQFILLELQEVADSASAMKRQRGRRGLEILESIKALSKTQKAFSLVVVNDDPKRIKSIDEKLLKVAKHYHAAIVTCDYNLNKVATVSGVPVLNVNELVNAVKTVTLPGENVTVKVIQKGKDREQGVGYLEDGTMVVVEDGRLYIGSEVTAKVHRVIQTSAGRMFFAAVDSTHFEEEAITN